MAPVGSRADLSNGVDALWSIGKKKRARWDGLGPVSWRLCARLLQHRDRATAYGERGREAHGAAMGWSWQLGSVHRWQKGRGEGLLPLRRLGCGRDAGPCREEEGEREEWATLGPEERGRGNGPELYRNIFSLFLFPRILYKTTRGYFKSKNNFPRSCTTISSTNKDNQFSRL
jgi:hypothetical protein